MESGKVCIDGKWKTKWWKNVASNCLGFFFSNIQPYLAEWLFCIAEFEVINFQLNGHSNVKSVHTFRFIHSPPFNFEFILWFPTAKRNVKMKTMHVQLYHICWLGWVNVFFRIWTHQQGRVLRQKLAKEVSHTFGHSKRAKMRQSDSKRGVRIRIPTSEFWRGQNSRRAMVYGLKAKSS